MAKKQESRPATLDAAFPRPTLPEPPAKFVHEAMKAFPAAAANGGNFWSGPLVTSAREWQAAPYVMAHWIIDANAEISLAAAAWGVFRLAELGLLSPTQEKANDGTTFWRTTPALWDWGKAGCSLPKSQPSKPRKKPNAKRDAQFVAWRTGGLDDKGIMAKWNNANPAATIDLTTVRKAIERAKPKT